jgi:phosphotransacetylase
MKFIETVFQKLRRHPKRIVFPEGTEPRILQAAEQFVKLQLGAAIVLGKKDEVEKIATRKKSTSTTSTSSTRRHRATCPSSASAWKNSSTTTTSASPRRAR